MAFEKLLVEALALDPKHRAELAQALLRSLQPQPAELTEAEWINAQSRELDRKSRALNRSRAKAPTKKR